MAKAEAPRIEGIVVQRETKTAPSEVNLKHYIDLLWVVAAGAVGVSLLCVTAGIALANPHTSAVLQPPSIIQIAVDNVNTAAALTVEAFPQELITPTLNPSNTQVPASLTFSPTVTLIPPTVTTTKTFIPITSTNRPRQVGNSNSNPVITPTWVPTQTSSPLPPPTWTNSPIPPPTDTNTPGPTRTPRPTRTRTPVPTDTSAPPTDTAEPPTETSAPPPTDTSAPPPTDTSAPPPTDTSEPQPTDTPTGP